MVRRVVGNLVGWQREQKLQKRALDIKTKRRPHQRVKRLQSGVRGYLSENSGVIIKPEPKGGGGRFVQVLKSPGKAKGIW